MAAAQWSINPAGITASVAANGTATASVPLLDAGVQVGVLSFTLTAARDLRVLWTANAGVPKLSGFSAWSND